MNLRDINNHFTLIKKLPWIQQFYQYKIKVSNFIYMAGRQMKQKVIDFQFSTINQKDQSQHYFFDQKLLNERFTQWRLQSTIYELGLNQKSQYSVKWVGYDDTSYIEAFTFCLFKGCQNTSPEQNDIFIKLKYSLYQLVSKCLKINERKQIVQKIGSAQCTRNLGAFLNKNRNLCNLFDKILKYYLQTIRIEQHSQFHYLKLFSKIFDFIKFEVIKQNVAYFQHSNRQKFYIIKQKACYFIVEVLKQRKELIQLKKIVENQEQNSILSFISPDRFQIKQQQKRILQYAAPKFITEGITRKKKPRYTEIQMPKQLQSYNRTNDFLKTKSSLKNQADNKGLNQNNRNFHRQSSNSNIQSQQKKNIKSQSRQKLKHHRLYYKQVKNRGKTGVIESTQNKDNSAPKSNHEITFDQKDGRKQSLKKIQLNLKKITQSRKNIQLKPNNDEVQSQLYRVNDKRILQNFSKSPTPPFSNSTSMSRLGVYKPYGN